VSAWRRWRDRRPCLPRAVRALLALACAAGALTGLAASASPQPPGPDPTLQRGRDLYVSGCASCHALSLRGVPGKGPSLRGVGAGPVDFYLSTGRMPLDSPRDQPLRRDPSYGRRDMDALVAYVASFGGPPKPSADPRRGGVARGFDAFLENCAGCHQSAARGGIMPGARVPDLQQATPDQIAEAVRMGPYLMPRFPESQIDQRELDSIAAYVLSTRKPEDRGGWGIGHIGPIPEGMVTWLLGLVALVLLARLIGERTTR
jgi:ubiquinol-cytochrome c reductase cytochrome c subunit